MRHATPRIVLASLGLSAVLVLAPSARSQCGGTWTPTTGGDPLPDPRGVVNATLNWDPDGAGPLPTSFTIGGRFCVANSPDCNVAFFDGTNWNTLPLLPAATPDRVESLTIFNGELVAVGRFTVARWNGSAWVVFGTVPTSPAFQNMKSVAVFQNELYVGGSHTTIGFPGQAGVTVRGISKWNGTAWSAVGPLSNGSADVRALALFNGNLVAGGTFSVMGGVSASNLASWNGTAWSALGNPNGTVDSLGVRTAATLNNTLLFAGGRFTSIGGVAAQGVARLPALVSSSWLPMDGLPPTPAGSLVRLFVRGSGTTGFECNAGTGGDVLRWNGSGWTQLFATSPANITCIALQGSQLIAGLDGSATPTPASRPALQRADGTRIRGAGIVGNVLAVADLAGQTVIAGDFQQIDGTTVNGIAIGGPGNWQPLGGGVTGGVGTVRAMVVAGNTLYVGGDFAVATGGVADRIALWNGTSWQPLASGMDGPVHALQTVSNGLLAGGAFTTAGGVAARGIAQFNFAGNTWAALPGGLDGNAGNPVVDHLALFDGSIIIGGTFTTVGPTNVVANNVARYRLSNATWDVLTRSGASAPGVPAVRALGSLPSGAVVAYPSPTDPTFENLDLINLTSIIPLSSGALRATSIEAVRSFNGVTFVLYRGALQRLGASPLTLTGSLARIENGNVSEPHPIELLGAEPCSLVFERDGDLLVGGMARVASESGMRAGVAQLAVSCPPSSFTIGGNCGSASNPTPLDSGILGIPFIGQTFTVFTNGCRPGGLMVAVQGFLFTSVPLQVLLPNGGGPCNLLVDPVVVSSFGVATSSFSGHTITVPMNPTLVGVRVLDQVLQLTTGPNGDFDGLSASQVVAFTIGRSL